MRGSNLASSSLVRIFFKLHYGKEIFYIIGGKIMGTILGVYLLLGLALAVIALVAGPLYLMIGLLFSLIKKIFDKKND